MNLTLLWVNILLPILSILIPVFVTVYTVNKRIREQNRSNHQPYLVLKDVLFLKEINAYEYYLTMLARDYRHSLTKEQLESLDFSNRETLNHAFYVQLYLRNIGYGVATNIKFYDLLTGEKIIGTQVYDKEKNQQLFTTFDIAASEEKSVQARILYKIYEKNGIQTIDHNRILCVYKDLDNVFYSFIISINVKSNKSYDFFAYQPSSHSYKKWIFENKKEFQLIKKEYENL